MGQTIAQLLSHKLLLAQLWEAQFPYAALTANKTTEL